MHDRRTAAHLSASTIARLRNTGERSVRRHLEELTRSGVLEKIKRPGTSTEYRALFDPAEDAVSLSMPSLIPPGRRRKQSMSQATVQFSAAVYQAMAQLRPQVFARDVAAVLGCSAEEARRALKVAKITPEHGSAKVEHPVETVLSRHPRNRTLMSPDNSDNLQGNRTLTTVELSNREWGSMEEEPNGSSSRRERRIETPQEGTTQAPETHTSPVSDDMLLSPISVEGGAVEQLFARKSDEDEYAEQTRPKTSAPRAAKPLEKWTAQDSAEEFRLRYIQRHGFCHINVRRLAMILSRNRKAQGMDARHEMKIFDRWLGSKYATGDGDPIARYLASFKYHRFEVEQEIAAEDPTYIHLSERHREDMVTQANQRLTEQQDDVMAYYEEVFGA